ncbi:uncharacterized protein LOC132946540 [Metopolophium dirhodum]|uniref:uncharacterized protein LOC132946540 n=1 Tax=Metopolophium dirhodum TaxID=44670 RepID=UPI00298F4865|nr:uncharacterized protein LOC132946540 [Metopolophium dirhodum]
MSSDMYELPSLLKTAYHACNKTERTRFDLIEAPDVDLRRCCESLFAVLKADRDRNENDDRRTMYGRSTLPVGDQRFEKICETAAFYGHIDCLRLAREIGVPWDSRDISIGHPDTMTYGSACDMAAKSGNLECLRYAWENGCPWDARTCSNAASGGHMDCLVFARDNGCPWDHYTCDNAMSSGQMDCLEYAWFNGCPWAAFSDPEDNGETELLYYPTKTGANGTR